uniref:Uncharacterized protein n=1 Tax=Arundo donax TaxID=35708 RepID=A0A0A8XNQ3_ARUDO
MLYGKKKRRNSQRVNSQKKSQLPSSIFPKNKMKTQLLYMPKNDGRSIQHSCSVLQS